MQPSSTTPSVTELPAAETHSATCWCHCMWRGAGPSHAHPIFLGEWDAVFCVGSMQNYYAAISRAPCMRGNAYHADRDRGRAEGPGLPLWLGFKCSLPFSRQSSGQKNVLYWGCLWGTRCMICPGTNLSCLNSAAQTTENWVKTLRINSCIVPLSLSGCPPLRMDLQWAPFNNTKYLFQKNISWAQVEL